MSEWKKVKLGDISLRIQPGPFGTQLHNSDYTEKGVPVIMPKDMIDGRVFHDKLEHVSEDTANRISRHKVEAGDIMVARKGDVRKCIYIRESEEGWITGSDCIKMQLNQKNCNSKFIFYQLRSPYLGAWLQKVSKGATMPSLNTSLLSNIEIVLPPIRWRKQRSDSIRNGSLTSTSPATKTPRLSMVCLRGGRRSLWIVYILLNMERIYPQN